MTPLANTCGCGYCPDCIAWDVQYSLEEWARIKAEPPLSRFEDETGAPLGADPAVEAELLSAPLRASEDQERDDYEGRYRRWQDEHEFEQEPPQPWESDFYAV